MNFTIDNNHQKVLYDDRIIGAWNAYYNEDDFIPYILGKNIEYRSFDPEKDKETALQKAKEHLLSTLRETNLEFFLSEL